VIEQASDLPAGSFDSAFIDADKENYQECYEAALQLPRPGGVSDNALWRGRLLDPAVTDSSTVALRVFNRELQRDRRVAISMLPAGDGLSLARKL
jgi:caffeoyl-CoA O-methyltransferase